MVEELDRETKTDLLNVHSIYESISGEAGPILPQGTWCTFVRLQGCPLRCTWCDTGDSLPYVKATPMTIDQVLQSVHTQNVLLTGGEPLSQKQCMALIGAMFSKGMYVQVETSGAVRIPEQDPYIPGLRERLGWVVDIKCPDSGEESRNRPASELVPIGEPVHLKFVVASRRDLDFAIDYVETCGEAPDLFVFSPMDARTDIAKDILDRIEKMGSPLADRCALSLQSHKLVDMP